MQPPANVRVSKQSNGKIVICFLLPELVLSHLANIDSQTAYHRVFGEAILETNPVYIRNQFDIEMSLPDV